MALAHASGDPWTLTLAHHVAGFMLAHETESTPLGSVLTDGTSAQCGGDCMQFKGIAARYLATLYAADTSHTAYRTLLDDSADAAWTIARDPSSRLHGVDWGAALVPPAQLNATSSAAMALAAAAMLDGPAPADPAEGDESRLLGLGICVPENTLAVGAMRPSPRKRASRSCTGERAQGPSDRVRGRDSFRSS